MLAFVKLILYVSRDKIILRIRLNETIFIAGCEAPCSDWHIAGVRNTWWRWKGVSSDPYSYQAPRGQRWTVWRRGHTQYGHWSCKVLVAIIQASLFLGKSLTRPCPASLSLHLEDGGNTEILNLPGARDLGNQLSQFAQDWGVSQDVGLSELQPG